MLDPKNPTAPAPCPPQRSGHQDEASPTPRNGRNGSKRTNNHYRVIDKEMNEAVEEFRCYFPYPET